MARPTDKASVRVRPRLDAIVDNIFSVAILFFLLSSYPGLASRHGVALAVLFGGPVIYLLVSWLQTRRLLMFHFSSDVGLSRLEQVIFILRRGVDQDAPHMFALVERSHE